MSKSWKSTLRLPKSTLLARPLPRDRPLYLKRCTDDFYQWQAHNRPVERQFLLQDGPPYANGNLHVGHALNKILKDMILRVKVQQGFCVDYRPGWDCHGLPIEIKAVGPDATKTPSALEIRKRARKLARSAVVEQMKEFRSYGIMADWDNRWLTMDFEYEIRQLELFRRMVENGFIYRRRKPVYWSPSSQTALAEAELEYDSDHISKAAYVRFPVVGDEAKGRLGFDGDLYLAVWTTTPWTLPANRAIAIHNDLEYCIVRDGAGGIIVGGGRVQALSHVLPSLDIIVDRVKGSDLRGLSYTNKLRGKSAASQPVIHANFVTADSGTGLVHLAPGHGQDDFEACAAFGIEAVAPTDDKGFFTSEAYPDDPKKLTSAPSIINGGGDTVLDLLGGDVLHRHEFRHKYPYDWRTKLPVVLRATEQWFADVGSIKSCALKALESVDFVPQSGRERLQTFVNGRSEWCISRQRAWGVPIPALYDEGGCAVMTAESIDHIIATVRERGMDAWFSDPADDPAWVPQSLADGKYRRGTDTMDVWFDSGSSWTQSRGPADVYLEGSDQHRGWFQSSLLTYIAANSHALPGWEPTAPFRTLVTHGFALDQDNKKMSKSRGNIISPEQIMQGTLLPPVSAKGKAKSSGDSKPVVYDGLGPDALRLWAAGCEYTRDVVVGDAVLRTIHTALIKYRVLLRMLLGSLDQPPPAYNPVTKLDIIALAQLQRTVTEVGQAFDRLEFFKASALLNRWAVSDLSTFYLEALKDRLYCGDGGGVLVPLLVGFLRMLAPMAPVLVEEAWAHRPQWMKDDPDTFTHPATHVYDQPIFDASAFGDRPPTQLLEDYAILSVVHESVKLALERARNNKLLGSSLQSSVTVVTHSNLARGILQGYADELDSIFVVSSVEVVDEVVGSSESTTVEEFSLTNGEKGAVRIGPPKMAKCTRCWRYVAPAEDSLCGRCNDAVGLEG